MSSKASVLVVGVAALAFATGAQAKPTSVNLGKSKGFTYMKATGKVSPAKKTASVFAKCPGKTESIGGGSSLDSKQDGVYIAESSGWDPDGWLTTAHQSAGVSAKVTSWAVCAKDQKVKRYRDSAGAGGGNPFYHTITCDQGYPVSGGNSTQGPIKNWILSQSWPFSASGWAASVLNTGPTADLTAEITCLKSFDLLAEYHTVSSGSLIVEGSTSCQTGMNVLGGGVVSDGFADETHLLETRPVDNLSDDNKIPDDAWRTTTYNDAGETYNYEVFARCL